MTKVYVVAKVQSENLDGEQDDLTYRGPIQVGYTVTVGWEKRGITMTASESGSVDAEVGSSGLSPESVEARKKIREAMYGALGKISRRVIREIPTTHKQLLEAARVPFWRESGEIGEPPK